MRHSIFIIAAASALVLASCSTPADPVREAITASIIADMPQGFDKAVILTCERIDSTTFAQEFERRVKQFELKRDADSDLMIKYTTQGKVQNAAIKREAYVRDLQILAGLDSLKAACADIMDSVAYYDYKFSADASGEQSGEMEFRDAYAAITPSFEVIGLTAKQKDLHKGLGKVIPGYLKLVKGSEDSDPRE